MISGSDGSKRKTAGEFTLSRTGAGIYQLVIPGKTGTNGSLIFQAADIESGTATTLASRAFLSYEYVNGKFVIQARKTASDTSADLADASFYFAWIDFVEPLAMPAGPRLRSLPTRVVVSADGVTAREAGVDEYTRARGVGHHHRFAEFRWVYRSHHKPAGDFSLGRTVL